MTIESIREFLRSYKRKEIYNDALSPAGVLMPLVRQNDSLAFLLTKRTDRVEHHKGQISFPGGAMDSNDESIIATALRETEEEIGLPRTAVEVLGTFDDFWTPTGFRITPVAGYVSSLPQLTISAGEVETILTVPVDFFLNPTNERIVQMERDGTKHDVYFYRYGEHEVWGATAAIIRAFLRALRLEH
ncbi:MAG TPA: CoA pyrophosphatase [Bacteroidota bacterium]|nr:CoA pyrophosphatase [Bacteroidota bacterium]